MKLYRYIPFESFIDIIQTGELVFVSPLKWEDKYEGILFRVLQSGSDGVAKVQSILNRKRCDFFGHFNSCPIVSEMIKVVRCQCWSKKKDTVTMWSIYSYFDKAIMIKIDRQKLERLTNESLYCQDIKYFDSINLEDEINSSISGNKLKAGMLFCSKRKAFIHEDEVRAFTSVPSGKEFLQRINLPVRVKINIPINEFIEEALVHPSAPDWYVEIVKKVCEEKRINFMGKSKLYEFELPEK